MLPSILSKIESLVLENNLFNREELDKFIRLLAYFKKNEWIYPGVLVRKLGITAEEAYMLLEVLRENGILQINYETYCHTCNQFEGQIFETFNEVPSSVLCHNCESELNRMKNTIVIYKVINDGDN